MTMQSSVRKGGRWTTACLWVTIILYSARFDSFPNSTGPARKFPRSPSGHDYRPTPRMNNHRVFVVTALAPEETVVRSSRQSEHFPWRATSIMRISFQVKIHVLRHGGRCDQKTRKSTSVPGAKAGFAYALDTVEYFYAPTQRFLVWSTPHKTTPHKTEKLKVVLSLWRARKSVFRLFHDHEKALAIDSLAENVPSDN